LRWVYNTSEAAQTAIEQLQADVLALENPTVYNKVIFDSVLPIRDASLGILPNDPPFYRPFTDISEITIAKEYFEPNENGYPKRYVQIDFGIYMVNNLYAGRIVDTATDDNISPAISAAAQNGEARITYKIYTFENGTSGVYGVVTAEGFTIDNGPSPNTVTDENYFMNSALDLFDTTEDLVLDFTPLDIDNLGFTYFKITAVAIP